MFKYNHYIALDWSKTTMAIATISQDSEKIPVKEAPADLKDLKLFLSKLPGSKILTLEETTTAQWLYTELINYVDEILVCNPHRNRLLSDGPKTDKVDAKKLAQLLKANLLKPVFHSGDFFFSLRKFVSGYDDLVKAGVRLQNQKKAILRAVHSHNKSDGNLCYYEEFVLKQLDKGIMSYEKDKKTYEKEFDRICRSYPLIGDLKSVPGIGPIGAVKIAAIVVDPGRFRNKSVWLSYCGLILLNKVSGGRSYGKKKPNYCRAIKNVFRTAMLQIFKENTSNPFREYYLNLLKEGKPEYAARQAVTRRIAVVALGVFKNGKGFENNWKEGVCEIAGYR